MNHNLIPNLSNLSANNTDNRTASPPDQFDIAISNQPDPKCYYLVDCSQNLSSEIQSTLHSHIAKHDFESALQLLFKELSGKLKGLTMTNYITFLQPDGYCNDLILALWYLQAMEGGYLQPVYNDYKQSTYLAKLIEERPYLQLALLEISLKLNHFNEAKVLFAQLQVNHDPIIQWHCHALILQYYLHFERLDHAKIHYQKLITELSSPQSQLTKEIRQRLLIMALDYATASQDESIATLFNLAHELGDSKHFRLAINIYAKYWQSWQLIRSKNDAQTIYQLIKRCQDLFSKQHPLQIMLQYTLIYHYQGLKNYQQALESANTCYSMINQLYGPISHQLYTCLIHKINLYKDLKQLTNMENHLAKANTLLKHFTANTQKQLNLYNLYGRLAYLQQKYDKLVHYFTKYFKLLPAEKYDTQQTINFTYDAAFAYARLGQFKEAFLILDTLKQHIAPQNKWKKTNQQIKHINILIEVCLNQLLQNPNLNILELHNTFKYIKEKYTLLEWKICSPKYFITSLEEILELMTIADGSPHVIGELCKKLSLLIKVFKLDDNVSDKYKITLMEEAMHNPFSENRI